jgi:hypothetical protein
MATKPVIDVQATPVTQKALPGISRLAGLKPTKLKEPLRFLIYGMEGVGKSSLAADAPSPIWIDTEGGSAQLEVPRYPFREGDGGHVPVHYVEVKAAIDDLISSKHDFKTLVIDTLDRLEFLLWTEICLMEKGKGYTSVEDFGYGKGYVKAQDEWRALCVKLDRLRTTRRMNIILLGHCTIRTFKSPETEDWDRYNLRLHDKAAGFLKEWCDVVGFAAFEEGGKSMDKHSRAKGWSTGMRLLKLERSAAFDAKSRIPLPAQVEMTPEHPWAPLAKAIEEGEGLSIEAIRKLIDEWSVKVCNNAELAKVTHYATELYHKSDRVALLHCLMELKRRPPVSEEKAA